jgi:hypothetical protein
MLLSCSASYRPSSTLVSFPERLADGPRPPRRPGRNRKLAIESNPSWYIRFPNRPQGNTAAGISSLHTFCSWFWSGSRHGRCQLLAGERVTPSTPLPIATLEHTDTPACRDPRSRASGIASPTLVPDHTTRPTTCVRDHMRREIPAHHHHAAIRRNTLTHNPRRPLPHAPLTPRLSNGGWPASPTNVRRTDLGARDLTFKRQPPCAGRRLLRV